MLYPRFIFRDYVLLILCTTLMCVYALSAQAAPRTLSGIVLDAESRAQLDDVTVELFEQGKSVLKQSISAEKPFSLDYDFNDIDDYTLIFSKADYFDEKVDLSNAFASGEMPEQMTISLSGEESEFIFWGATKNRETSEVISHIKITVLNLMTGERLITHSDQDGRYQLGIDAGYEYKVVMESPHHLKRFAWINYCNDTLDQHNKYCFSGFNNVSLNEQGGVSGASVFLDKIELGKKFKVDNIYYDYNKATIKSNALPNLRKVLYILRDNPQIIIELGSHADSRGSDAYNLDLSQQRADAAVEYIVRQGLKRSRIQSKGYGETVLVNHCKNGVDCPDELHGENRRTEFIIVGIDETHFIQK